MKIIKFLLFFLFNPFIRLAGKVNWRRGRPYKCKQERWLFIRKILKPGMVVLTHKDYELTNFFIRGYWTHSAMIVSEGEIVEAVRQGVMKRELEEFFSAVDDFIILEPRFCNSHTMQKATEFANNVIGYPYNFYFSPRERSYYCTELIFNAYAHASGSDLIHKGAGEQTWNSDGTEFYKPQQLAELNQFWQIVVLN